MNRLMMSKKVAGAVVATAVGLALIAGSTGAYARGDHDGYPAVDRLLPSQLPTAMQPTAAANGAIAGLTDRDGDYDGKIVAVWHGQRVGR
jgi:hypothetical protein